jgi:peptidoglycan/LPS O-acetylase OafA/YrhL
MAPTGNAASGRYYRPELDALRFFAFFAVFLFHGLNDSQSAHLSSTPWLFHAEEIFKMSCRFGLSMFFFLSSYLITILLRLEKQKTGTIHLKAFYVRRALRIWPLYFAYLLLICLLRKVAPVFQVHPLEITLMLLFAGNWYFCWHRFAYSVLVHLWSISVEEQFYLLFPSAARAASIHWLRRGALALGALALLLTFLLVARGASNSGIWANSFVEAIFFAGGTYFATHASLTEQRKSLARAIIAVLGGFGLWLIAGALWIMSGVGSSLYAGEFMFSFFLVAVGCSSILWGFLHLPLALLPRPLIYLGKISYGLYVFHALMQYVSRILVSRYTHIPGFSLLAALLLTIAAATLSYEYFEKPFLRLKSRFEVVHSRTA